MDKNKLGLYVVIGVSLVLNLVLGGLLFTQLSQPIIIGGAGSTQTEVWQFLDGIDVANLSSIRGVLDNSDSTSTTITAKQICDYSIINRTVTDPLSTTTLPTVASLQAPGMCLSRAGSYKDVLFENKGVVSSTMIFAVGDASSTINYVSSSTPALNVNGGDGVLLRFYSATKTNGTEMIKIKAVEFGN